MFLMQINELSKLSRPVPSSCIQQKPVLILLAIPANVYLLKVDEHLAIKIVP